MLVKPVSSLALCALALFVAAPAGASEASATVVVTPAASPSGTVVKVVHRSRRATKKKVVVRVMGHHAEPAKTPLPAVVLATPLTLTKTKAHRRRPHLRFATYASRGRS